MGVSLIYDAKADMYSLDQTAKDDLDKLIETSRNASQSGTKQTKRHQNENMEDKGGRVTVADGMLQTVNPAAKSSYL